MSDGKKQKRSKVPGTMDRKISPMDSKSSQVKKERSEVCSAVFNHFANKEILDNARNCSLFYTTHFCELLLTTFSTCFSHQVGSSIGVDCLPLSLHLHDVLAWVFMKGCQWRLGRGGGAVKDVIGFD